MHNPNESIVLVDNSNLFIAAKKASAVRHGLAQASQEPGQDNQYRLNFQRLLVFLSAQRKIIAAVLVGSRPPANDELWGFATRSGFAVFTPNRGYKNKEKAVDTELVARGAIVIAENAPSVLVIASGDRDYCPLAKIARERGWFVR